MPPFKTLHLRFTSEREQLFAATPCPPTPLAAPPSPTKGLASNLAEFNLASSVPAQAAQTYEQFHDETVALLGLSTTSSSWAADLLRLAKNIDPEERRQQWLTTLRVLLSGRWTVVKSMKEAEALLSSDGGNSDEEDRREVLAAVLVVLELRYVEAERDGELLDPLARSLRYQLKTHLAYLDGTDEESHLDFVSTPSPNPSSRSTAPSQRDWRRHASAPSAPFRSQQSRSTLQPKKSLTSVDPISKSQPSTSSFQSRQPPPTLPPATREQQQLLASPLALPGITMVQAFAGTGKTTALLHFAQHVANTSPSTHLLYTCFNRSMVLDAELRFQRHGFIKVEASTISKIAHRHLIQTKGLLFEQKSFRDGDPQKRRALFPQDVIKFLGLQDGRYPVPHTGGVKKLKARAIANRVIRCLTRFAGARGHTLTSAHIIRQKRDTPNIPETELLYHAQALWARIRDWTDTEVALPTWLHVKLCQLDDTFLRDDKAFIIMYDEVQDSSDADLDIVMRLASTKRVVLVGDEHQAIYGLVLWRGGNNTWVDAKADVKLRLSHSFRFGSSVAGIANTILRLKAEKVPLIGQSKPGTVYRPLEMGEQLPTSMKPWTVLFRTNQGLIDALFTYASASLQPSATPLRFALKVNRDKAGGDPLKIYYHAHDLARATPDPSNADRLLCISSTYPNTHRKLKEFTSWDQLERAMIEIGEDLDPEDIELMELVKMGVKLKEEGFREQLDAAASCLVDDERYADVVLGVTHQIKGLEWPNVALGKDFFKVFKNRGKGTSEELNILYVSSTRAKERLVLNDQLFRLALLEQGLHNFFVDKTQTTCVLCFSPRSTLISYSTPFPSLVSPSADDVDDNSFVHSSPFPPFAKRHRSCSTSPPPSVKAVPPARLDTEPFPCCLECAGVPTYAPLRHFVELTRFLEQWDGVDWSEIESLAGERSQDVNSSQQGQLEANHSTMMSGVEDSQELVNAAVEAEIAVVSFWDSGGGAADAPAVDREPGSPTKRIRVG